jgi:hypothetical protein
MPRKGYTAVTLSTEMYELIKRVYDKHKAFLKTKYGVRSVSSFVEWAIREYLKQNFPATFEEWLESLDTEKAEKPVKK